MLTNNIVNANKVFAVYLNLVNRLYYIFSRSFIRFGSICLAIISINICIETCLTVRRKLYLSRNVSYLKVTFEGVGEGNLRNIVSKLRIFEDQPDFLYSYKKKSVHEVRFGLVEKPRISSFHDTPNTYTPKYYFSKFKNFGHVTNAVIMGHVNFRKSRVGIMS